MKISPVSSPANTVGAVSAGGDPQAARIQTMRSVRMNTNATPGAVEAQVESLPPATVAPLTIGDVNDPAVAEATQPLSPQYAALAKQRRALQVKERELADREKAMVAAPAQGAAIDMARLKSEPLNVLREAGVSYAQLTEAILKNQESHSPEIQELREKLKELEEGVEKKFVDREQQTVKQYLDKETREASRLIAQGDEFEMVREQDMLGHVPEYIKAWYEKTGEALTAKQALEDIENQLLEDALKIAAINKVQGRLAPPPVQPSQPQRPGMRTLTNRDTASIPMSRKARALAAFQGTLKK